MSVGVQVGAALIQCPYNSAHRLKRQRLQQHLLKCRLLYPDVVMMKCPFDQTHLIPQPELEMHVVNCSGRNLISQYKYKAVDKKEEEPGQQPILTSDENWDDSEAVDYNPQTYAQKERVLRRPDLFQPSARKVFREQERKRLGEDSAEEDVMWTAAVKEERTFDEDSRPPTPPPPKWPTSTDRSRSPSCDDYQPTCSADNTKRRGPAGYALGDDPYYNSGNDYGSGEFTQNNDDKWTSSGRRRRNRDVQHFGSKSRFHHDTEHY